jgi:hypothetical protein
MLFANERLKPMQGLHGFATQTQIKTDKAKSISVSLINFDKSLNPVIANAFVRNLIRVTFTINVDKIPRRAKNALCRNDHFFKNCF